MSSSADSNHAASFTGHVVVDSHLHKIGTVTDVIYDGSDDAPRWAVVKTGMLSGEHYMPLDERAYVDNDGRVVATIDKTMVRNAPRAHHDHVLDRDASRELCDYYDVSM
jgi:hypothetical protein